jgi:aspartate racemase
MTGRMLGVVGGIGPESTLDYYRRLVDGWHARVGPTSHPRVVINSVDSASAISAMVAGDLEPMRVEVQQAVEQLAGAGAGLALIASVASHSVYDAVAPAAPIPMLSIVEETCRAAVAIGSRRPAVFGSLVSVEGAYFARPFEAAGIELVRPAPPERRWIHDAYLRELVAGEFRDDTRRRMVEILDGLVRTERADALILAGTELSVLLPEPAYAGVPVLNAAAIHVDAALDWLQAG